MNLENKNQLREKIDAGVKAAVADALEEHRRAGRLVAVMRGDQVVLVTPEPGVARETEPQREPHPQS